MSDHGPAPRSVRVATTLLDFLAMTFLVRLVTSRPTGVSGWLIVLHVVASLVYVAVSALLARWCFAGHRSAKWACTGWAGVVIAGTVLGLVSVHGAWALAGVLIPGILAVGVLLTVQAPSSRRYFAVINADNFLAADELTAAASALTHRSAPKTRRRAR